MADTCRKRCPSPNHGVFACRYGTILFASKHELHADSRAPQAMTPARRHTCKIPKLVLDISGLGTPSRCLNPKANVSGTWGLWDQGALDDVSGVS